MRSVRTLHERRPYVVVVVRVRVRVVVVTWSTWRESDLRAVGQCVVAVHLEVDGNGVQDGLQVLLLF